MKRLIFFSGAILCTGLFVRKFRKLDADISISLASKYGKSPSLLRDQVVWITDATKGIGEYLAYELSQHGVKLILSGPNPTTLLKVKSICLVKSQGSLQDEDIKTLPFSIVNLSNLHEYVQLAIEFFGTLDILVHSTNMTRRAKFEDTEINIDKTMFDINVFGAVVLTSKVIPQFIKQGNGHVVLISSIAGKIGVPASATYAGSKFALHGYFECLRAEFASQNIDVTFICTGPTYTDVAIPEGKDEIDNDPESPQMKVGISKAAYYTAVAIVNKKDEVWVCIQPLLSLLYLAQYCPTFYRKVVLKRLFDKEIADHLRTAK